MACRDEGRATAFEDGIGLNETWCEEAVGAGVVVAGAARSRGIAYGKAEA
jgi:hypothetical protein